MRRRFLPILIVAGSLSSCGGGSNTTGASTTTIPSAKDVVRAQLDGVVRSYLENMVRQVPTVTSKIELPDVAKCVKERLDQFIEAAEPQAEQPEADFASMLMNQAQSSLYGIIGVCSKLAG